jgi:hypothetical protein
MSEQVTKKELEAVLAQQTSAIGEKIDHLADLMTAYHADTKRALAIMDYGARFEALEDVSCALAAEIGKPEIAKRLRVYERPAS